MLSFGSIQIDSIPRIFPCAWLETTFGNSYALRRKGQDINLSKRELNKKTTCNYIHVKRFFYVLILSVDITSYATGASRGQTEGRGDVKD